jgi:signal transduction histidine kinase
MDSMPANRRSVAVVVAATLVTVTTVLMAILGTIVLLSRRNEERARLERVTAAQTDELAVALALPVWNIDRAQIERILDSQSGASPIEAITVRAAGMVHSRVRDAKGRFVHSDGRFAKAGLITAVRPITFGEETIGAVHVFSSPRYIDRQVRGSVIVTVLATLAMDIIVIASVYWILWRAVLRPIVEIERFAGAVSAGSMGTTPPLHPAGTAELESLRASIETMVRLLDQRYAELQELMARRLEMEEALRRSQTMSTMGALVAGVAHEVRNPLFGMSALLDAYVDEMNTPDLMDLSNGLREQVTRLTHLMRELLELGRPVKVDLEPGALRGLIDDVIRVCVRPAAEAAVALESTVDFSLPLVQMDRSRLGQVFENLIHNSLQHAPPVRKVTIHARELVHAGRSWIECTVEDDGSGFQPADLDRVFEPFFTRRERGIGLGMSIVQRIVEEHSGRVSAGNRPDGGAVVTVRLPAAPVEVTV